MTKVLTPVTPFAASTRAVYRAAIPRARVRTSDDAGGDESDEIVTKHALLRVEKLTTGGTHGPQRATKGPRRSKLELVSRL